MLSRAATERVRSAGQNNATETLTTVPTHAHARARMGTHIHAHVHTHSANVTLMFSVKVMKRKIQAVFASGPFRSARVRGGQPDLGGAAGGGGH